MPLFHPDQLQQAAATYRSLSRTLVDGLPWQAPDDLPAKEYHRSPAAALTAKFAQEAGLFHFHFERRTHQALPESWVPSHQPELAEPPQWSEGILPEAKYQSFRHDLPIASFHPHHRAKWAAHELCHGLVGYGWRSDATPFFHALAGRLAELLPVALWYFFDEAHLQRCPIHHGQGALFRAFCADCEAIASATPDDPQALTRLSEGVSFVERELAAVAKSRRLGRPIDHHWTTINLSSDGVAYAQGHRQRLSSPLFHEYAARFTTPGAGRHDTLDALEERVIDVMTALLGLGAPRPLAPTPVHGRWRWMSQDLAWRLLLEAHHRESKDVHGLLDGLEALYLRTLDTKLPPQELQILGEDTMQTLITTYSDLARVHHNLAPPADLFATGYPIPSGPPQWLGLADGLETIAPLSALVFDDTLPQQIQRFSAADGWERAPLITRWSRWVDNNHDPRVAAIVSWEAAAGTIPRAPLQPLQRQYGDGETYRLSPHAKLWRCPDNALALAEGLDEGRIEGEETPEGVMTLRAAAGTLPEPESTAYVLAREEDGEVLLLELDPMTADELAALGEGQSLLHCTDEERDALLAHGVLEPARWIERSDSLLESEEM